MHNGRFTSSLRKTIELAKTDVWSHWTTLSAHLHGAPSTQQPHEPPHLAKLIVRTVQFRPANHSFQTYAVSIEEMNSRNGGRCSGLLENNGIMTHITNNPIPRLPKAPQPPLSHPGATPSPSARRSFHETPLGRVLRTSGITSRRKACHCLGTPNLAAANCTNSRMRTASACATLRP